MNVFLAPTVPIGRIEWDSTRYALQECTPDRQQQMLPYLLALYSFISWWQLETDILNHCATEQDDDSCLDEHDITPSWCERPEIIELINIADVTIQGVHLAIYPCSQSQTLVIHYPTLVGIAKAEYCVGVELSHQNQCARLLGYISTQQLRYQYQMLSPTAGDLIHLPVSSLSPIQYLPQEVASPRVQDKVAAVSTHRLTKATKFPLDDTAQVAQVLAQLGYAGYSPFEMLEWDRATALQILHCEPLCKKVLALRRVVAAFHSYGEQMAQGSGDFSQILEWSLMSSLGS